MRNWTNRTLFTGDNLTVMRGMNTGSVDPIYLDPPFNSKRDYAAPIGSQAAGAEFKDTWTLDDIDVEWINLIEDKHPHLYRVLMAAGSNSDKSYLAYMAVRLLECHRLLADTGSIYLHCDPTMSHYLKLVMDAIWGRSNFRNEIVWHYHMGTAPKADFRRKHDIILRYSATSQYMPVAVRVPRRMEGRYNHTDEDGRRYHINGAGKRFYEDEGVMPDDVWSYLADPSFTQLNSQAKERTGYPTQKPLKLLERIIAASSNPGDVVFDPFCGCATTLVAAEQTGREWIGCDISQRAIEIARERLSS